MVAESDRKIKPGGVRVPAGGPPEVASAWADRAPELAPWTLARRVNRFDVWGAYTPPDRRGQEYVRADGTVGKVPGSYTAPAVARRGQVLLTEEVLARHYRGRRPEHVIGLHTTSPENTSLWGGPEVDWHGPQSTAPAVNLAAALAWYDKLVALGFTPLLTDSNGAGGYHGPLVLFAEPVPTERVFAFVRWLITDHAAYGLPSPPEIFPKQARIDPGRYGNWLRLPGRHHTREHWSRVWDGGRWLEGHEAIDHILALAGDPPGLIPADLPLPRPLPRPALGVNSAWAGTGPGNGLSARITAYMTKLPNLAEGQGRDAVAYHFAAWLARDMALPDGEALRWLEEWDRGNSPPKGRAALAEILANARRYGRNPVGCGLGVPRRRKKRHAPTILTFTVEVR
jgi:hypothetical protein